MKFFLIVGCAFILCLNALSAQKGVNEVLLTFDKEIIDLGHISKGDIIKSKFNYTNTSNQIIEIDFVSTCECTQANWSFEKIHPGQKGEILFEFDSGKKDMEEPIDVDVILKNEDIDGNPIFIYLSYVFRYKR